MDQDIRKKALAIGLSTVLGVSLLWIGYHVFRLLGPSPAATARPPSGREWEKAREIQAQLNQDPRFHLVSVIPNHENMAELLFVGEVPRRTDVDALRARVEELQLTGPFQVNVEPLAP